MSLITWYYYAGCTVLVAVFYVWASRILSLNLSKANQEFLRIKQEHGRLEQEHEKVRQSNAELQSSLEQTIALYDISKQISKALEAEKVFENFKEELGKYIEFDDCRFVRRDEDLMPYRDYSILQLDINKAPRGYLVTKGIKEADRYKFHILSQQFLLGMKRAILYQSVQELAISDSLTGLFSRRYYLERFKEEIERSQKFGYKFSCLMLDIDNFKDYNDRYGHLVGDAILKEMARTVKENMRQIDLVGRYGGEEFLIILTETDKEKARLAAERLRQSVEQQRIRVYDEDLMVTVSIGISTYPDDGKEIEPLIDNADTALYEAKRTGRNRVCLYGGQQQRPEAE